MRAIELTTYTPARYSLLAMAGGKARVAVMGAGAVGGYFGARLAQAGHDVAFVSRGEHLAAMQRDGLKIKSAQGDFHIRSLFTSDPEEVGTADLVLFCVKSYSTEATAAALRPLLGEKTGILLLQNGVDNPDKIARVWGWGRIIAGVVYIGARLSRPGVVEHSAGGRIVIGALDPGASFLAATVREIFSSALVPCAISPEIRRIMWGKLVWNAPFCAISCLARATSGEIVQSESLRKLALDGMAEVIEAARCEGFELAPTIVDETLDLSRGLGDFKPSMLQDLEAGKALEYEAFNGVVVDALRRAGKPAPVNQSFYRVLQFLDHRIRAAGAA